MSDKGTPHNIGQAFFESLGKGLSALPGILEQERQKQMQNLQLQMEQERHAINVENAQIGLEKSRAGMSEYIRRASLSLQEKAVEDAQAEAQAEEAAVRVGLESLLQGTPIGGIVESAESAGIDPGIGQLQDILGAQGVETSFSIGGVKFRGQEQQAPFDINTFFEQASGLGLEPDDFTITLPDGTKVSAGRPRREPAGLSKGERERSTRALTNSVMDRLREINPSKLKSIMAQKGFKMDDFLDEANLQTLAESKDFSIDLDDNSGIAEFFGFSQDIRTADKELQKRIAELRSFREGAASTGVQTDDQVAQQKVKTPTPRQDAISFLSQTTDNWAEETQEVKDRATQRTIDFQVANGRLPNDIEELLNWLQ